MATAPKGDGAVRSDISNCALRAETPLLIVPRTNAGLGFYVVLGAIAFCIRSYKD